VSARRKVEDLEHELGFVIEENRVLRARLHDAITTVEAWHRAGIKQLHPLEVIDLLTDKQKPPEEGTPAAPVVHPQDDGRDPMTGCLPVTAQ
jgi:hypothetical protein